MQASSALQRKLRKMDKDFNTPVSVQEFVDRYAGGIPPWQIDRPQMEVLQLMARGKFKSPVLDVGCGTGDNAIELARRGYRVLGIDPVPEALRRAREKVSRAGLAQPPEFMEGDALRLGECRMKAETVLDSAVFHVFSDSDQEIYVRGVGSVLSPGGRFHILSFSELEQREPGPRRLSLEQICRPFREGWELEEATRCRYQDLTRVDGAQAWLVTFRKA